MPDEPDNLVLVHLREMRAEMRNMRDEVRTKLEQHDKRFDALEKRLDDVHEAAILSVGFATLANHKLEQLRESLTDHGPRGCWWATKAQS